MNLDEDLEDIVTCWVCFEIFQNPVTLYCNHSFCKSCLLKIYNYEALCPFCREPYSYPLPDVNHELDRLAQQFISLKKAQEEEELTDEQSDSLLLQLLPEEILVSIFSNLTPNDLCKIAPVCRTFKRVGEDNIIWRNLWSQKGTTSPFVTIKSSSSSSSSWKNLYRFASRVNAGWQRGRPSDFKMIPLRSHTNYITHFHSIYNTQRVISSSGDGTIKLWNIPKPRTPLNEDEMEEEREPLIQTIDNHTSVVNHFVANEIRLVSGSDDCTARSFDMTTGQQVVSLTHPNSVVSVYLDEPSRQILSSSGSSVYHWDIRSSNEINQFTCPPNTIITLKQSQLENNTQPSAISSTPTVNTTVNFGNDRVVEFQSVNSSELVIIRRNNSIQVWDSKGGINPTRLRHPFQPLETYVRRPYHITHTSNNNNNNNNDNNPLPLPHPLPFLPAPPPQVPPDNILIRPPDNILIRPPDDDLHILRRPPENILIRPPDDDLHILRRPPDNILIRRPHRPYRPLRPPRPPPFIPQTQSQLQPQPQPQPSLPIDQVNIYRPIDGPTGLIYWISLTGGVNCMKILSTISNSIDGTGTFILIGNNNGIHCFDLTNGYKIAFKSLNSPPLVIESDGKRIAVGTQDGSLYIFSSLTFTSSVKSSFSSIESMTEFLMSSELICSLKEHTDGLHCMKMDERKIITGGRDNCIKVWDLGSNNNNESSGGREVKSNGGVKRLYSLLGGSMQSRSNNPAHPLRIGCSGVYYDETKIIGSFNSLLRVYSFEDKIST